MDVKVRICEHENMKTSLKIPSLTSALASTLPAKKSTKMKFSANILYFSEESKRLYKYLKSIHTYLCHIKDWKNTLNVYPCWGCLQSVDQDEISATKLL